MKRIELYLSIFTCALFAVWGLAVPSSVRAEKPTSLDPAELELGAKLYRIHCQSCHAKEGKSKDRKLNLADDEWKSDRTPEGIERVIADGVKGSAMLPKKNKLKKEEIAAIAKYVLTFNEK